MGRQEEARQFKCECDLEELSRYVAELIKKV